MTSRLRVIPFVFALTFGMYGPALAWGASGHRMVGVAAAEAFPATLPAFLRTREAAAEVGELSREPDRIKGSGRALGVALDSGHFLDVLDDGTVLGGPRLDAMPTDREAYETALRAAGTNAWKAGWLYYSILESQQQLTRDFAMWRVLSYAASTEKDPGRRAWFRADLKRREAATLQTLGRLSHYVSDGSQPLHMSIHYNGWGEGPNPEGFTTSRIHGPFEGDLVARSVRLEDVRRQMSPGLASEATLEETIASYLRIAWAETPNLYRLEKAGGLAAGDLRGAAFAAQRLGAGAAALRDFTVLAWRTSEGGRVGWPEVSVADALAGRADIWTSLYGKD
jgi:hypothetical protein